MSRSEGRKNRKKNDKDPQKRRARRSSSSSSGRKSSGSWISSSSRSRSGGNVRTGRGMRDADLSGGSRAKSQAQPKRSRSSSSSRSRRGRSRSLSSSRSSIRENQRHRSRPSSSSSRSRSRGGLRNRKIGRVSMRSTRGLEGPKSPRLSGRARSLSSSSSRSRSNRRDGGRRDIDRGERGGRPSREKFNEQRKGGRSPSSSSGFSSDDRRPVRQGPSQGEPPQRERKGRDTTARSATAGVSSDDGKRNGTLNTAKNRDSSRESGRRTFSQKRTRSPSSSRSRSSRLEDDGASGNHRRKRGRDSIRRTGGGRTAPPPSPQAKREMRPSPASNPPRGRPDPHPARKRWSPSPSPTAPTASESIRRSRPYRSKRDPGQTDDPQHLPRAPVPGKNGQRPRQGSIAPRREGRPEAMPGRHSHKGARSPSPPSSSSSSSISGVRRRRRQRPSRGGSVERDGEGGDSAGRAVTTGSAAEDSPERGWEVKGGSPSASGGKENGVHTKEKRKEKKVKKEKKERKDRKEKKDKKEKRIKKEKKSKDKTNNEGAEGKERNGRRNEASASPRRSEETVANGKPAPTPPVKSSKASKPSKSPASAPAATLSSPVPPVSTPAGKEKRPSTGKKSKRPPVPASSLLSFEDEGEDADGAEFQSLGAATLNEFKRSHKKSQTEGAATAAAAAAAAADGEVSEETPSATARLDLLLEKKRSAVLGPSKISAAESRAEREYQEDRHTVVQCLHAPDDAHTKFEACPPCFFAVYDGHNGHLASDIAKSKLHTYVAKAAPNTGLRGEPKERLEGLLRAAFASTEAEILRETSAIIDNDNDNDNDDDDDDDDDGKDNGDKGDKGEDGDDGDGGGSGGGGAKAAGRQVGQDGTTVTACLLVGDLLVTANVGDSRAVLGSVGHADKLRCRSISTDHKPEDPREKRRIKAAGGEVVFNGCYRVQHENVSCRLAVSRSLGDRQFKGEGGQPPGKDQVPPPPGMKGQLVSPEPSVQSVKLEPQDRVVIVASDGLWDVMTGMEAVDIAMAAHGKASTATGRAPSWANALANGTGGTNAEADFPANALVRESIKRGTADNVTAIVAILSWD